MHVLAKKFKKTSLTGPYAHGVPLPCSSSKTSRRQRSSIRNILNANSIQTKLTIGQPNDRYEQEADRVADQVMHMPAPELKRQTEPEDEEELLQSKPVGESITSLVQRMQDPEEEDRELQTKLIGGYVDPHIQRLCPECDEQMQRQSTDESEEEDRIQARQQSDNSTGIPQDLESNINSLKGGGQPLSQTTRAYFEPRFGYDFSKVRVHADNHAADVARSVNARAFTLGDDIVFGAGQYTPENGNGQHLLAHELTHVVQQGGSTGIPRKVIQRRELRGEDFPWDGIVSNASGVWFRKKPDMAKTSKVQVLLKGTEVAVNGVSGNWLKVNYNGVDGYMHKDYIIHKFETEARSKIGNVCSIESCRNESGCNKSDCEKEAAEIAETYVSRVNKIRKPNVPNVQDRHWGWLCYEWAGLLTREFNKMNLKCWKLNWVGFVGSSGSLLHNYIHASLDNIKPTGTSAPKRGCGMILDPWRTGDPIVYDLSWSWHKWNYIHDPATNNGKSYDGTNWNSESYPPPWTPAEPAHSPTIKVP